MDLDHLLTRFDREYLAPNSISEDRRHDQLMILRRLAASLDHPMTELCGADVRTFIGEQIAAGRHPNTVRKYLGMIRSFTTWAEQAKVLPPALIRELQSVRNPRGSSAQNKPRPYKPSEIARLRAAVDERYPVLPTHGRGSRLLRMYERDSSRKIKGALWRYARRLQLDAQIALALELGLRRIEILRMTIPALHPDNEQVVVLTAKQEPGKLIDRAVPYSQHARAVIEEWLDLRLSLDPEHTHPWLALPFDGDRAAQTRPQTIYGLERALFCVGPWEWRRLRHTAATEWLRAGVPIEKLMVFMGHATIQQTLAYAKIVASDVDSAFRSAEEDFARRLGLVS